MGCTHTRKTTMNLQVLKTSYLARHWMSLDESARSHLSAFVAIVEGAVESAAIAVEHLVGLGYTVTEPGASAPDVDPAHAVETVTYSDGTTATGTPPLPVLSPAQQDAAEQAPVADDPPALTVGEPVDPSAEQVEPKV